MPETSLGIHYPADTDKISGLLSDLQTIVTDINNILDGEFLKLVGGILSGDLTFTTNGPIITTGTGDPEGAVTAKIGSVYLRKDGGADTSLYVKESGTGNTGWTAK